jgi:hypothetical protein
LMDHDVGLMAVRVVMAVLLVVRPHGQPDGETSYPIE